VEFLHPLPLYQGSLASMSSPDALGNARSAAAYRPLGWYLRRCSSALAEEAPIRHDFCLGHGRNLRPSRMAFGSHVLQVVNYFRLRPQRPRCLQGACPLSQASEPQVEH
jgi:hypothetical protein